MKAEKIRKQIRHIIVQGNNVEIANLFREIVKAHEDEFTEDNIPTLASFLVGNLFMAITPSDIGARKSAKDAMVAELEERYKEIERHYYGT